MSVIPALSKWMQEDEAFKASLDCMRLPQKYKINKIKSNAGKIHFSGNGAICPVIRQEKLYKPFVVFLAMIAGSPEPKFSNKITMFVIALNFVKNDFVIYVSHCRPSHILLGNKDRH